MIARFEFVTENAASEKASQDEVHVFHRDTVDVVVLADGAGNSVTAGAAARTVVDVVAAVPCEDWASVDEHRLLRLFRELDERLVQLDKGESTGVVCLLRGEEIIGASVGDSGAWVITDSEYVDLTAQQRRKPLLGSGAAMPVVFRHNWANGKILVASDGLIKYADPFKIIDLIRREPVYPGFGKEVLRLVRMPSGGYQDDVSFALGQWAGEFRTGGRRECNRWIYDLVFCGECGAHVPVFRDLGPGEQRILDDLTQARPHYRRIAEATGLSDFNAKVWRTHLDKPLQTKGKMNSTPCPKCGRWLRTPLAKQCLHCGADWHK